MSFSDHKITAFTHKIADLPDQPNLPADELKARFDACPEELRQSVNGICDDAARLEARVEGIVVETFGDTIDREMLSDELAAELDAKATQAALSAEQTARTNADSTLSTRITTLESRVAQKVEIYFSTYTGQDGTRTITLDEAPEMVIIACEDYEDSKIQAPLVVAQGQNASLGGTTLASLSGKRLVLTHGGGYNKDGCEYALFAFC